ncbi:MAG: cell division FtsK/SpoIIIE, partial [Solirubrobacterales bacterium]|nr:cell division FtsK/SpoIIIE [Solirubrobacterales bacterium]
ARAGGKAPARAKRSAATGVPRLPALEQRQLDLLGLGLVALAVFLVFPLWLGWEAGAIGAGLTDGLAWGFGVLKWTAPLVLALVGGILVLKPVMPGFRPFRAGGIVGFLALALALGAGTLGLGPDGPHGTFWRPEVFEVRGGAVGEGLFWIASTLLGTIGAHILAVFGFLVAATLLTGASAASIMRSGALAAADTTRSFRAPRAAPDPDDWFDEEPEEEDAPAPKPARRGGKAAAAPDPEAIWPPEAEPRVSRGDEHVLARDTELDGSLRYPDLFGEPDAPVHLEPTIHEPEVDRSADHPFAIDDAEPEAEPFEPPTAVVPAKPPVASPPGGSVRMVEDDEEDDEPVLPVGEQAVMDLDGAVEWLRPRASLLTRSAAADAKPDTAGNALVGQRLIEALAHFNVDAQVVGTVSGPHITRFELRLAPGIKMSKVAQMKDDLAYALAATDIRILAPIPGKTAVGVEVPNLERKMVTLGDVYGPPPEGSSPLTVWLGKDVSGKAIHADLAKMPHILVAGTTGAGKSACINGMLSSILLRATPEEVRLILVDPKQVELNHYEAVPHLLTPVITSPRAAANALQNLVREMEWRYGIMSMARTRSLPELNKHRLAKGEAPLPYVLCVIDELADLMMVAPADVEDSIIRIAQKARAVGIHLVLATQSPRVDVITGMIKANVPSRIAFSVSSQTDSRVILDQNGAESLLGMGDMLFSAVGSSKLHRIQGAYIDEPQIAMLTEFWAAQGEPELREDLLQEVEAEEDTSKSVDGEDGFDPDEDPLLGDAIELVVEMGTASTSMLQRRLRLGYTRAGRLIDMLERRGVISGYEGSKPRQVLVNPHDLPRVLASLAQPAGAVAEDATADVVLPGEDDVTRILDATPLSDEGPGTVDE